MFAVWLSRYDTIDLRVENVASSLCAPPRFGIGDTSERP